MFRILPATPRRPAPPRDIVCIGKSAPRKPKKARARRSATRFTHRPEPAYMLLSFNFIRH